MFYGIESLELRSTHIELGGAYCGGRQHKGKAKALAKHMNKVLPAKKKIIIPPNALSMTIDNNCIVKFYLNHDSNCYMHLYKPGVGTEKKGNGKVRWCDFSWPREKCIKERRPLKALRIVKGGVYKMLSASGYIKEGAFAVDAHVKYGDKLEVCSINKDGDGLDSKGELIITKGCLKHLTLLTYR